LSQENRRKSHVERTRSNRRQSNTVDLGKQSHYGITTLTAHKQSVNENTP